MWQLLIWGWIDAPAIPSEHIAGGKDVSEEAYQVVLSTCGSMPDAERIARDLVEKGIAACVNIIPGMRSIYRWKGQVEEANEVLMMVKIPADRYRGVEDRIKHLHAYDLPEVIALPVSRGSRKYLRWLGPASDLDSGE
jgi:periplasmic divalent cation tolerance protein